EFAQRFNHNGIGARVRATGGLFEDKLLQFSRQGHIHGFTLGFTARLSTSVRDNPIRTTDYAAFILSSFACHSKVLLCRYDSTAILMATIVAQPRSVLHAS